jgi:hypothetical protein
MVPATAHALMADVDALILVALVALLVACLGIGVFITDVILPPVRSWRDRRADARRRRAAEVDGGDWFGEANAQVGRGRLRW